MTPPDPLLQLAVSRAGDDVVLHLRGEADIAEADRLTAQLSALTAGTSRRLVVDLSRLEFLDLAALRTLLVAERELSARGATLVLRSPTPRVRRLLDLMEVSGHLAVEGPAADE